MLCYTQKRFVYNRNKSFNSAGKTEITFHDEKIILLNTTSQLDLLMKLNVGLYAVTAFRDLLD